MTDVHPLVGMLLAPGEMRARITSDITPAQRSALLLCLDADRLDFVGPRGWRNPTLTIPIAPATIRALVVAKLMIVITRSKFKTHARLTARGHWYARTIATERAERTRIIASPT